MKKVKKVTLQIPCAFENDLRNRFQDFFDRVIADIDYNGCCGNYEKETAEMLQRAFEKGMVE